MTHALTIRTDAETVPYHADPILAAIDRHAEAWSVFQVAPEGAASIDADAYEIVGGPNAWTIAQTREADLSRCLGVERIERLPTALPSGRLVGPVIDLRPLAASTPVRFARLLSGAGEVVAALVIIGGGIGLTGFASLL